MKSLGNEIRIGDVFLKLFRNRVSSRETMLIILKYLYTIVHHMTYEKKKGCLLSATTMHV